MWLQKERRSMSRSLFITGTGTDVGKTYVSGLILKKLREAGVSAAYYKAAMSGNSREKDGSLIPGDALYVKQTAGLEQPLETMCPYVYESAVSPHLASRLEGNPVRMEVVRRGFEHLAERYSHITVEGSGGICCPVAMGGEEIWMEDVIQALAPVCLIVADAGLGTINAVALTAAYMKSRGIGAAGILLNHFHPNDVMEEDNKRMCEYVTGLPVLACIEEGCSDLPMETETLLGLYRPSAGKADAR